MKPNILKDKSFTFAVRIVKDSEHKSLRNDCDELMALLVSIIKSSKGNIIK
jgi:hypothetical protein